MGVIHSSCFFIFRTYSPFVLGWPFISIHSLEHCSRLTRSILLGSQILHFWPEGFAYSLGCQNAVIVIGRSSSTSAFFLLWLSNLPSLVQLLAKNQLGRYDHLHLELLLDLALLVVVRILPRYLLLGIAI